MSKLNIERKAHTRRAYLREDGVRVKSAKVRSSVLKVEDKGAPGRTPKARRWFEPQVETGWEKGQSEGIRRAKVLDAHKGDELASARAMGALANVTTDRETRGKARADAKYFYKIYREMPKRRNRGRRAPRITPRTPRLRR